MSAAIIAQPGIFRRRQSLVCHTNRLMDLRDGVKVSFEKGWLHVRGSNTEPIIRLVAEAEDERQARQILDGVFEKVAGILTERTPPTFSGVPANETFVRPFDVLNSETHQ